MAIAALIHWLPVLLVMIPSWYGVLTGQKTLGDGPLGAVPIVHGVLGAMTQLLMSYTVTRMFWAKQLPPERPKWLMRTILVLWFLTVGGGIGVYVSSYVV
jgi:hypothetical protein